FFFQAEDGIRDDLVTGVQTCALPICFDPSSVPRGAGRLGKGVSTGRAFDSCAPGAGDALAWTWKCSRSGTCWPPPRWTPYRLRRSEERRVGKEVRARGCTARRRKTGL